MPCFLKPRSASLEMSASSVGSTRSRPSKSCHLGAEARVGGGDLGARRAGADDGERRRAARSSAHASSVPMTRPPNAVPGIGLLDRAGREDRRPCRSPCTSRCRRPRRCRRRSATPSPSITSISFFLNSPATPPVSVLMTFVAARATASKSTVGLADLDAELAGLADLGEDVGDCAAPPWPGCTRSSGSVRRPSSFSTTAVFIPSCAARIAAT